MRSPGWLLNGKGKRSIHGSRHRKSQMKFFSSGRYKAAAAQEQWGFANHLATKYKSNGLFGIN